MNTLKNFFFVLICLTFVLTHAQHPERQYTADVEKAKDWVKLINWTRFKNLSRTSSQQTLMGEILLNANKYALTNWWEKRGFKNTPLNEYLDLKGVSEHYIRPVAAEAEALAASLRMGLYDSSFTGIPEAEAEAKTIQLIKSLSHSHLSISNQGWGRKWQSALWAGYTGFAAWMMWDKLDKLTRNEVLLMIYEECEWIMNDKNLQQIKSYRDLNGNITSPGDTGAEENAWDSLILSVACAMMPENPNHNKWMNKLIFLNINALSRPKDLYNTKKYNGKPFNKWLIGTNINNDGTIVNHHFIHPDYMTSPFEFNPIRFFALAQAPTPKVFKQKLELVFSAFTELNFKVGDSITGGIVKSPGGTIFNSQSNTIFYPLGTDWGKDRRMNFASFCSTTSAFAKHSKTKKEASKWVLKFGQTALEMQNRFDDGHTYTDKSEDSYPSREEWVADMATTAYITETLKLLGKTKFTNKNFN
ncbi:hypothetical protein [Aestuariibaculum sediminum]|uniref:Uncharacterized protein n=1 Tax=Aestuariibaculum sediminum TaxID=2770637 RepID=A0A8J6Q7E6_9FLAO|nr:hypothetical protein [Aestuariibaculum sediminum]MBD0831665.1 hypothetical protein [Aestuariibaculum sediminum]